MSWIFGVGVLAVVVLGLDRLATRIVRPNLQPVDRSLPALGLPHEDVVIDAGEVSLAAWVTRRNETDPDADAEAPEMGGLQSRAPVVILAHGWTANHGVVARLGEPLARRGHTVLFYDVRGHGRNPPRSTVTFKDFRDDALAVIRWANHRFRHRPLVFVGHSMGGAAGVVAAADGARVDGLVLIATPSDVLRITAEYLSDQGLPGDLLVTILRPFFWLRVGGTFGPLTPSRRIGELEIPILMIQPELDARVVRSHADRLSSAAGISYHVIEDREHTDVLSDGRTLELVEDFLSTV